MELRRVEYVKKEKGIFSWVVYELDRGGKEKFYEQEPMKVSWFPFAPTERELEEARKRLASGKYETGWEDVVDLDSVNPQVDDPVRG